MTLQALTYFVALVEEMNFTRAAQKCFVTQPALSRAVSDLEKELGRPLLLRGGRGLELTQAGRLCYDGARRILRQCDTLVERVRSDSDATEGYINLGYLFNGSLNYLAARMRQFSKLYPNVEVRTTYEDFNDAKRMLHSGELDLALLSEPNASSLGDVDTVLIAKGALHIVVHCTHRLFERDSVSFSDIREEKFILWDPEELPGLHQSCLEALKGAGIEPKVEGYAKKLGDAIAFATLKGGLGLTTKAASESGNKVTRIIPIADCASGFGIMLARLRSNDNPFAAAFFAHIKLMES